MTGSMVRTMSGSARRPGRATARATASLTLVAAAVVALRLASTGQLAAPPLTSLDALGRWVDAREPTTTALALLRFGSELAGWYALALSALHVLAGAARIGALHVVADALTIPAVRRMVHTALGAGLLMALPGDAAAGAEVAAGSSATMRPVDDRSPSGTASMTPADRGVVDDEVATRPDPAGRGPTGFTTWRVATGESFWSIASDVLESSWQRQPSRREIAPFWRHVVDLNRGRLAVDDDPDLIFPGQVFEIPPVPAPA